MYKKIKLKNKTNKTNKINKINNKKIKKYVKKGGWGEHLGFPPCLVLGQFLMTDESLYSFKRDFSSPTDCFINALQLIGILDSKTSNILRITSKARDGGFTADEIELIFMYATLKNCKFMSTGIWSEFETIINQILLPGNVTFAGFTGHVFLIGRDNLGTLVYIDPQINLFCPLSQYQPILQTKDEWWLLFFSEDFLTQEQKNIVTEYISKPLILEPQLEHMPSLENIQSL